MKIFQYGQMNQGTEDNRKYVNSTTTRWEDVFGSAQNKTDHQKNDLKTTIDSGYFTQKNKVTPSNNLHSISSAHRSPTDTRQLAIGNYGGLNSNSLTLRVNPRQIEYDRYKKSNDVEKQLAEKGEYDTKKITNPFHYTKTNNYFNDDLRKAFRELYGNWDGSAEDGEGFAYVDKYGFSGVAKNFFSAMVYSMDGKVYHYKGRYEGGDAVDANGDRIALLGLEHAVIYGNFRSNDHTLSAELEKVSQENKQKGPFTQAQSGLNDKVDYSKLSLFDLSNISRYALRSQIN